MKKKLIIFFAGLWARNLLTIARLEEVDYFVDEDALCQKEGFNVCVDVILPVHGLEYLSRENKDEIVIVVSDNKRYDEAKDKLQRIGLVENVHFFNGWKLNKKFYSLYESNNSWKQFEEINRLNHDKQMLWEQRAEDMATLIPKDIKSVMDLGCGNERLRKYLKKDVKYYGLDYIKRNEQTIVCDLNEQEIPKINVDVYYMAGLLCYINDIEALFLQMKRAKYLIFDYYDELNYLRMDAQYTKIKTPALNAMENYFTMADLLNCLYKTGFIVEKVICNYDKMNTYYFRAKRIKENEE